MPRRERGDPTLPPQSEMQRFLADDLRNDLRWLCDAAVVWEAADSLETDMRTLQRHADVHTMHASFSLARSLYEFFFDRCERYRDDARARHFCSAWDETPSALYTGYFAPGKPANKRILHLPYGRPLHSGGTGYAGPDHLNQQVVPVARDLLAITRRFLTGVEPVFTTSAQRALDGALFEAENASKQLGRTNPLL